MRQPIYSTDNDALDRTSIRKSFSNGKCDRIEKPMLSAVESHFGPGRPYASTPHHYGSQAGTNLLAAPCPIVALPSAATVAMSPSEFARPHPKTTSNRYNGGQSLRACNGISSSSRGKYSQLDQSSPVNLAVSSQLSTVPSAMGGGMPQSHKNQTSPSATSASSLYGDTSAASIKSQHHSQSEQDAIHNTIASLYDPSKLPYSTAEAVAAYQQFSYPTLYGRPASIYGTPSLYQPPPPPPHALTSVRNGMHRTPYDPYVHAYGPPSSAYSPPAPARPGLSPQSPIGAITTTVSQNNTSISAKPVLSSDRTSTSSSSSSTSVSSNPSSPSSTHMQAFTQPNDYFPAGAKSMQNVYRPATGIKEKETHAPNPSNEKPSDFKVPSGKEGSLKHRILTRPYGDKEPPMKQSRMAPMPSSHNSHVKSSSGKNKNNNNNNSTVKNNNNNNNNITPSTKFCRGSWIELSSGELKRVEDMRAEDFVISSNKNSELQLVDTTVVKLSPNSRCVVITFTYNNSTVDIDSSPGHPFFVYGKGWASYSPDDSMEEYSLKCQPLEVGDIFMSLRPRDSGPGPSKTAPKITVASVLPPPSQAQPYVSHQPQYYSQPQIKTSDFAPTNGNPMCMPQNLSRKQSITYTVPTTATATAMTSRPISSYEYQQMAYTHASHTQHLINDHNSALRSHYNQTVAAAAAAHYRSIDEQRRVPSNVTLQRTLSHDSSSRKYNNSTSAMAPPPPPTLQSHSSAIDLERGDKNGDAAIDATTRSNSKRRWSAPDAICNVDGCQLEQRKCTKH